MRLGVKTAGYLLISTLTLPWLVGCSQQEKTTAEIDVGEAQAQYDEWVSQRIAQIEANDSLSDGEKQQMIEEVKQAAEGQMNMVQGLAEGQADDRQRER